MPRVVIVDDNEITRAGTADLLSSHADIEIVAALDHTAALAWKSRWNNVDVVIVDAADETLAGDQFPGIEVVCRVREHAAPAHPTVVVLTGHFLDDGLRHRMWEAGADFYYSRTEITTGEMLQTVVLRPGDQRRVPTPADANRLAALGVTPASSVNDFVRHVERDALAVTLDSSARMKQGPAPERSRWWYRLRVALSRSGKFRAVNADGASPHRDQDLPSVAQLRRIYEWAARSKHVRPED